MVLVSIAAVESQAAFLPESKPKGEPDILRGRMESSPVIRTYRQVGELPRLPERIIIGITLCIDINRSIFLNIKNLSHNLKI